jgi:hypothetical protein
MAQWILKNRSGQFDDQPEGFNPISALENRFFICECPTQPTGDFVVACPEQYQGCDELYLFDNGKRTLGIADTRIQLSEELDYKYRRAIMYTSEQLALRLDMIKWIALNVFVPDKQRMLGADSAAIVQDIEAFTSDKMLRRYVADNLYYDL